MEETRWFVITGGPSSGKTKTIEYLAYSGFQVIPEIARLVIDIEMSRGQSIDQIRASEEDFQKEVWRRKVEVEEKLRTFPITFFDRGLPDSIAYYRVHDVEADGLKEQCLKRRYAKVFFLESLPYEQDYARVEDQETVDRINQELEIAYEEMGYNLLRVPCLPIPDRASLICEAAYAILKAR